MNVFRKRGTRICGRRLSMTHRVVGPRHDPYLVTRYIIELTVPGGHKVIVELEESSLSEGYTFIVNGLSFPHDGREIEYFEAALAAPFTKFERMINQYKDRNPEIEEMRAIDQQLMAYAR